MKKNNKLVGLLIVVILIFSCNEEFNYDFEQNQIETEIIALDEIKLQKESKENFNIPIKGSTSGTGFLATDPNINVSGTNVRIEFSSNATVQSRALFRTTIGYELGLQSYTICSNNINRELWVVENIPNYLLEYTMNNLYANFNLVGDGTTTFGEEDEDEEDLDKSIKKFKYSKVSLIFYEEESCN